jgi:GNAT superfamily N-acetyltransferase
MESLKNFIFERATQIDLPAINEVYLQTMVESYKGVVPQKYLEGLSGQSLEESIERSFKKDGNFVFVVRNPKRKVIGFIEVEKLQEVYGLDVDAKLNSIYVLPDYQRKGIGSKFFEFVLTQLILENINSIILEALEISPFKEFYVKNGGKIVGFSFIKLADEEFRTVNFYWRDLNKI